jgi:hypothetical protein
MAFYSPRLTAPLSYRSYELKGEGGMSSTNIVVETFFMYPEGIVLNPQKGINSLAQGKFLKGMQPWVLVMKNKA